MRFLFLLSLFISLPLLAKDKDCEAIPPQSRPLSVRNLTMVGQLTSAVKNDYKKRPVTTPEYRLALAFDTNFKVPVVGTDKYFGRIYFTPNSDEIKYRDEMITERRMKDEGQVPGRFYYTGYKASDINGPQGLSLVKAAGAEVTLKSNGNFSTTHGGRLHLRVKIPMEEPIRYTIDVVVQNGNIQKYIVDGNNRIPFDSIKINAQNNMFGKPSILSGIDNVEFIRAGRVAHSINQ